MNKTYPCNINLHYPGALNTSQVRKTEQKHKDLSKMFKIQPLVQQQLLEGIVDHPFLFQGLISAFILCCIAKWLHNPAGAGSKNLPPSPPRLPIIGNLHQLSRLPHHDLRSLSRKHGPLMLLHLGSKPTLVVSSAEAAREIMKTHDLAFADRSDRGLFRRLLYDSKDVAFTPYGDYWRQMKSICVIKLLSKGMVQSFHPIREEETAVLVNKIAESPGEVNLSTMFAQLTNDIVCRSSFGRKLSVGENQHKFLRLVKKLVKLLGTISAGDFIPLLSWINLVNGFDARVRRVARGLDDLFEGMIRERMEERNEEDGQRKREEENFVDILIDMYRDKSSGGSIDRDSIKAVILDVFAAGTDTTSTVLEWAMSELLRHPSMMEKLQHEVREIATVNQALTDQDIGKMHYLKMVIKETLRLHTPIPLLIHRSARHDVKVLGYDVSAGTTVIINAWAISRDSLYWDEPEKFHPERFLDSSIDFKGMDFELIPFGSGRRVCPGIAFTIATIELVLANLVQKFDWKLPHRVKELDMSERPGLAVHRAVPLVVVASKSKRW